MVASSPDLTIAYTSILAPAVNILLSLLVSLALDIERTADGGNPFTASSMDDMAAKVATVFTSGSHAGPVVKLIITASYSARRGSRRYGPVVMCIIAGCLKTVGEGPGSELTFCSSELSCSKLKNYQVV
jgi:hypothetical protein